MADEVLEILKLRAELLELGSAVSQLKRAGLDSAAAQLLMSRKRAELANWLRRYLQPKASRSQIEAREQNIVTVLNFGAQDKDL